MEMVHLQWNLWAGSCGGWEIHFCLGHFQSMAAVPCGVSSWQLLSTIYCFLPAASQRAKVFNSFWRWCRSCAAACRLDAGEVCLLGYQARGHSNELERELFPGSSHGRVLVSLRRVNNGTNHLCQGPGQPLEVLGQPSPWATFSGSERGTLQLPFTAYHDPEAFGSTKSTLSQTTAVGTS